MQKYRISGFGIAARMPETLDLPVSKYVWMVMKKRTGVMAE